MILNLQNESDIEKAKDKFSFYLRNGKTIDLTEKKNTRTTRQNSALHLLFTIVSNQLNEMGIDFKYMGLKGKMISTRHNPHLVKEHIWKPIQKALFNKDSTKDINTEEINEIVDVLANYFGEKGIVIQFPSKEQLETLINK